MKKLLLLLFLPVMFILAGCSDDDENVVGAEITIDLNELRFPMEGGSLTLNVTSNSDWTISGMKSWFEADKTSGKGDAAIVFTTPANPSDIAERFATISFNVEGADPVKVVVKQSVIYDDIRFAMDDEAFKAYAIIYDKDGNGKVSTIEAAEATIMDLTVSTRGEKTGLGITSLKGLEYFTGLQELDCSFNAVTLDDLSNQKGLLKLSCEGCGLENLDIQNNMILTHLNCSDNNLEAIGFNVDYSALVELNCEKNNLKELSISKFKELEVLICGNNQLEELNTFSNPKLKKIDCRGNQIKTVNTQQNKELEELYCQNNQIANLITKNNENLLVLDFSNNKVYEIDLKTNTSLTNLNCSNNNLQTLNIRENRNLQTLDATSNMFLSRITAWPGFDTENPNYQAPAETEWRGTQPPSLVVTPATPDVVIYKGDVVTLTITANVSWKIAVADETVCTIDQKTGEDDATVNLTVSRNNITAARSTDVTITSEDIEEPIVITIEQEENKSPMATDVTTAEAGYEAESTASFTVVSKNMTWTATSDQTWCTISPASGGNAAEDKNETVTAAFDLNPSNKERSAKITLTPGTVSDDCPIQVVTLTQKANPAKLTVDQSTLSFEFDELVDAANNNKKEIKVSSTASGTATVSGGTWLSLSKVKSGEAALSQTFIASSAGASIFIFATEENPSTEPRTAQVMLNSDDQDIAPVTITVTQGGKPDFDFRITAGLTSGIVSDKNIIDAPNNGGTYNITVKTNLAANEWEIVVPDAAKEWCEVTKGELDATNETTVVEITVKPAVFEKTTDVRNFELFFTGRVEIDTKIPVYQSTALTTDLMDEGLLSRFVTATPTKAYDKNEDGYFTVNEAASVTTSLSFGSKSSEKSIKSLKGIEYLTGVTSLTVNNISATNFAADWGNDISSFVATAANKSLKTLNLAYNKNLTVFDVSALTNLEDLNINYTKVTNLDLTNNEALIKLNYNGGTSVATDEGVLSSINLTKCTELTLLNLQYQKLTSIDLSNNTKLGTTINLRNNLLTSIDLSKCVKCTGINLTDNALTDAENSLILPQEACALKTITLSNSTVGYPENSKSQNKIKVVDARHVTLLETLNAKNVVTLEKLIIHKDASPKTLPSKADLAGDNDLVVEKAQ